jgi:hypothetical protein
MQVYSPLSNGEFSTEPYEAAWASEAIAFVYVSDFAGASASLDLGVQISADGRRWIDFHQKFDPMSQAGGYYLQLRHFGTWLRLVGRVSGGPADDSPAMIAHFYWDLKE